VLFVAADHVLALVAGAAVDVAVHLHPAAAEADAVDLRIMIAPGQSVHLRRAAELAHADHERRHPAGPDPPDPPKARIRRVQLGQQRIAQLDEVLVVRVVAVELHGHEPHARLHQPPGQERRLPFAMPAVAVAERIRLVVDAKAFFAAGEVIRSYAC
jgi:hypothetical protein